MSVKLCHEFPRLIVPVRAAARGRSRINTSRRSMASLICQPVVNTLLDPIDCRSKADQKDSAAGISSSVKKVLHLFNA